MAEQPRPFDREETFRPIRVDESTLMGVRDDGSPEHERARSARRMSVISLLLSLLWGFGFLSILGIAVGIGPWIYLRRAEARGNWRWVALSGWVLGVVGLALTIWAGAVT